MKIRKLLPILVAILVTGAAAIAETEVSPRHWPFPLFELEAVLSQWLESNGFEVTHLPLPSGGMELVGNKEKQVWQIHLTPHSPLATEIRTSCTSGGQSDRGATVQELWSYLSEYTADQFSLRKDVNQSVPTPVLANGESVVCIRAERDGETVQFSGFFIDRRGLILSTAHDLKGNQTITVTLHNGVEISGHLVGIDHYRDLALIEVRMMASAFLSPARGRDLLREHERLYLIGCPMNHRGAVRSGFVEGPPRRADNLPLWQVSMEILPGSSGSPVFDADGTLVAVTKGRFRGKDSIGFLIPLPTVMEFLRKKQPS